MPDGVNMPEPTSQGELKKTALPALVTGVVALILGALEKVVPNYPLLRTFLVVAPFLVAIWLFRPFVSWKHRTAIACILSAMFFFQGCPGHEF